MGKPIVSERVTEQIVRRHLEAHSDGVGKVRVWEQLTDNERINNLLKKASKRGQGPGRPEFIVGFDNQNDFLVVFECKADIAKHQKGEAFDQPAAYAVDGALHYAKFLSREFNVLAVAVSGIKTATLSVSHFWHLQGEATHQPADFPAHLLPLSQYLNHYIADSIPWQHGMQSLGKLARRLNEKLHTLKVTPAHRALLVSAILVSLDAKDFRDRYRSLNGPQLLTQIKDTHFHKMKAAGVESFGLSGIMSSYGFMTAAGTGGLTRGRHLGDMVADIDKNGMPIIRRLGHYDSIGQFYLEFLRYSNNDKELGIVLTPPHITELAADMAEIGKNDVVYDNCAGTGGFLIGAMKKMLADAEGDKRKQKHIKGRQIFGVEEQAIIVSLLHSNMFLHGDGRSNMKQGDCFSSDNTGAWIKQNNPTVGLLNPPFKDKASDIEEIEFVLNNMSTLKKDGYSRCVAILPMPWTRAATGQQLEFKRQLLAKHTLEAVISLPDKLFYNSNASVVTCMMVFTAHCPHASNKKTWFAYGKDDGFEMRHHFGRVDRKKRWDDIRKRWVSYYRNRENIPGFSIMRHVEAEDEWCAEAYIQTDYRSLTQGDYQRVIRDFVLAKLRTSWVVSDLKRAMSSRHTLVALEDIFTIERGHGLSYNQQTEDDNGINFVARVSDNNGVRGRIAWISDLEPKPAGMLTVAASGSVLETFLQTAPFYTGVGTLCLTPRRPMSNQVKLYYCMLIRANKFRYNYGREANTTLGDLLLPAPKSVPAWVTAVDCDHTPN